MPTESQLRDAALPVRVRNLIEDGRLPVMVPKNISAGYGSDRVCAACDQPITSTQVEYDIQDERTGERLSFHLGCHVLWQIECAAHTVPQG